MAFYSLPSGKLHKKAKVKRLSLLATKIGFIEILAIHSINFLIQIFKAK